jgi:NADPH:quinone reductase-like Zn-dependent oxidoreductase
MKAFLVEKIGENEFLSRVQDISTPKCAENEIVIKVTLCEQKDVWLWLNIGIWLDEFCIENFDLYLE